jgi:hypothetical protein
VIQQMLQLSLSEGASAVSVQISGTDYTIDLAAGVQRNTATGFERPLREVCLDEDEESDEDEPDSSGFSTRPQGSSTDAWTHANTLMMSTWISRDRYEFTGTGHCSPLFFPPHSSYTGLGQPHFGKGKLKRRERVVFRSRPDQGGGSPQFEVAAALRSIQGTARLPEPRRARRWERDAGLPRLVRGQAQH